MSPVTHTHPHTSSQGKNNIANDVAATILSRVSSGVCLYPIIVAHLLNLLVCVCVFTLPLNINKGNVSVGTFLCLGHLRKSHESPSGKKIVYVSSPQPRM